MNYYNNGNKRNNHVRKLWICQSKLIFLKYPLNNLPNNNLLMFMSNLFVIDVVLCISCVLILLANKRELGWFIKILKI
jgi:hypothetical protein